MPIINILNYMFNLLSFVVCVNLILRLLNFQLCIEGILNKFKKIKIKILHLKILSFFLSSISWVGES